MNSVIATPFPQVLDLFLHVCISRMAMSVHFWKKLEVQICLWEQYNIKIAAADYVLYQLYHYDPKHSYVHIWQ